jgi:DNA-binding TFAR19-related protein (PDSD5 family)
LTGIQAQYERKGHQLEEAIHNILEKNGRLRRLSYVRPELAKLANICLKW